MVMVMVMVIIEQLYIIVLNDAYTIIYLFNLICIIHCRTKALQANFICCVYTDFEMVL